MGKGGGGGSLLPRRHESERSRRRGPAGVHACPGADAAGRRGRSQGAPPGGAAEVGGGSVQWARGAAVGLCFPAVTKVSARAAAAPPGYMPVPELMQLAEEDVHKGLRLVAQQRWEEARCNGQGGRRWVSASPPSRK